jgi:hypothetical protein
MLISGPITTVHFERLPVKLPRGQRVELLLESGSRKAAVLVPWFTENIHLALAGPRERIPQRPG